jgi:HEAT repeat protein
MIETNYFGNNDKIQNLITQLNEFDGWKRLRARRELIWCRQDSVPFLIKALSDPRDRVRWEATKAMVEIRDPSAAGALVKNLNCDSTDIRWASAEALIELKRAAIQPLLAELVENFKSSCLREAAYHILHILKNEGYLAKPGLKVLKALESVEAETEVAWAANDALIQFNILKLNGDEPSNQD